jgi:hypothetical protein
MSHPQELRLTLCHPVCSSEQGHSSTEEHMERSVQVGAPLPSESMTHRGKCHPSVSPLANHRDKALEWVQLVCMRPD